MNLSSISVRDSLKITITYFVVSVIWIFFSDRLLGLVTTDSNLLLELQTYKGWFFVSITSVLLFLLIEKSTSKLVNSRNKIENALNEKQVVLSELHHRVKNNLSIICGLIDLQTDELNNAEEIRALKSIQYRIYSLAEIEELFYQNRDMSSIPFHEFLNHLIISLNEPDGRQFHVDKEIEQTLLNIKEAVPFGLMVNEIFSQLRINGHIDEVNHVRVRLFTEKSDEVNLEIGFDNISSAVLSRLTDNDHIESILINLFIDQLHATSEWQHDNNSVKFSVSFNRPAESNSSSLTEELPAGRVFG